MLAIVIIGLLGMVYVPQLWVRWVMRKHAKELAGMPGTGGELAQHLLGRFGMAEQYIVEETTQVGDHFSPADQAVRLSPANYQGKSLTAIAVAAHEVGHAIQHFRQEAVSTLRARYIPLASRLDAIGLWILRLLPLVAIIVKAPAAIFLFIGVGIVFQLLGAFTYLIVLPEEYDASFNKALPILSAGGYLPEDYEPAVKEVLKAAALTYFAAALARILNISRLFFLLRR